MQVIKIQLTIPTGMALPFAQYNGYGSEEHHPDTPEEFIQEFIKDLIKHPMIEFTKEIIIKPQLEQQRLQLTNLENAELSQSSQNIDELLAIEVVEQ